MGIAGDTGNQPPQSGNPPEEGTNGAGGNGGAGGPPAGGQPAGGGQMTPPQSGQTGDAGTGGGMVPPQMITALIQMLGKISGIEVAVDSSQPAPAPNGSSSAPSDYAAAYKQSGGV